MAMNTVLLLLCMYRL